MSRSQKIAIRVASLVVIRLGMFAFGFMIAMVPFFIAPTPTQNFNESFDNVMSLLRITFGFAVMVFAFVPHADVIVKAFGKKF